MSRRSHRCTAGSRKHSHSMPEVLDFSHTPSVPEPVRSTHARELHTSSTCRAYLNAKPDPPPLPVPLLALVDCATSALLIVDRKFDQVHFDLFSCPDSIFVVRFSIRNLDIPGNEISRPIHVIVYGDNFAQWSQVMSSYLKGRKLWLYVSSDRLIPEKSGQKN